MESIGSEITLSFNQYEAAGLIEATHDSLFRKVRWTISPAYEEWHRVDFGIVKASIDALSTAYLQLYMAFRQSIDDLDEEKIDPSFEESFVIGPEAWEVIDQIRSSDDWDQVERHLHGESLCRACRDINRIPKA